MTQFDIVSLIILLVLAIPVFFILFRNHKVAELRHQIIQEDYDESMKNIDKGIFEEVDNYSKLPSYGRMVFSFKPLKKEHWL